MNGLHCVEWLLLIHLQWQKLIFNFSLFIERIRTFSFGCSGRSDNSNGFHSSHILLFLWRSSNIRNWNVLQMMSSHQMNLFYTVLQLLSTVNLFRLIELSLRLVSMNYVKVYEITLAYQQSLSVCHTVQFLYTALATNKAYGLLKLEEHFSDLHFVMNCRFRLWRHFCFLSQWENGLIHFIVYPFFNMAIG